MIGGLGHHYGGEKGCGYKNISIQIIDQVKQGDKEALVQTELYWQDQLRVFIENGGNAHCRRKDKWFLHTPYSNYETNVSNILSFK